MNIVTSVYDKLSLFSDPVEMLTFLVDQEVQTAPSDLRDNVIEVFGYLDSNTPQQEIDWSRDLVKDIALYDSMPSVFRAYQGEEFSIQITVTPDKDFSGYVLTIRRADDNSLLSPTDTAGKSADTAPVQYAYIKNISFNEGQLVKVNVLLEKTGSNGDTNGDVVAVITEAYLLMVGTT